MTRTALARGILVSLLATLLGSSSATALEGELTILKPIEFGETAIVREEVRDQCQLQTRLPEFIAEYAKQEVEDIVFSESVSDKTPGKVLIVEITDVSETGNFWTGRSGALTIRAELREDGEVIGTFRSRRATQGGAFGGYKGRCAFLGRCAKALGRDVAKWLEDPVMDATGAIK